MCGKTGHDMIRNDNIRERVGVALIIEKTVETWQKICRFYNKESRLDGG